MTEHVHEWMIVHCFARCDCGGELEVEEIERRLNATERLSAGHAMSMSLDYFLQPELGMMLMGYANALKSGDD